MSATDTVPRSPFAPVLAPHVAALPPVFARQFLFPEGTDTRELVVEGEMDHVGHRPFWLGPLFWLLAQGGVLVAENGEHVPTRLTITAQREADGGPAHVYRRVFRFPRVTRRFNAITVYDAAHRDAADYTGPGRSMYFVWRTTFQAPDTLHTVPAAVALCLGPLRLWVPRVLWPWLLMDTLTVQQADLAQPDTFRIAFVIRHPLLGEVFEYRGRFRVRR
jgi:hypothetical protein